jgi:uncharacterized protein YrrD
MDVKSLKGIAVVSIEEGEKVGVVDNVLFDLDPKRVIAFKLIKPGLLRSGAFILPMEDVESVGPDAVMIRNRDKIREQKGDRDYQNRPDLTSLSKLRVVTQDGTYVGTLATVQFDPKTGLITQLEVTGGGFMDRLRRNQIVDVAEAISIGTDVAVIPDKYAPRTDESDSESQAAEEQDEPEKKRGEILQ